MLDGQQARDSASSQLPCQQHAFDCLQNAEKRLQKAVLSAHQALSYNTYAQYHSISTTLKAHGLPTATFTTSTANICDSILTGSLDWAIYSADQHTTYLAFTPRIWQLQQYSHQ